MLTSTSRPLVIGVALLVSLASVLAQSSPRTGLYRILSGEYHECCGIAGNDTVYSLPNPSQSFLKLILDTQRGTASMVFLAADQQTVFKTVPCLIGGAIDFNFDYGFLIGSSIVFHVDPGPPPYQKFWNYTVSNSVSGLRIDGLVGTATAGCADTPTQFSHTDVLALYIPTPKLNVISFSKDRGAQLFVQGTAGETNVVEASHERKS